MKNPQSILLNIALMILLLSCSLGRIFDYIVRTSSEVTYKPIYLLASNLLNGFPFLILGGFFLIPKKWIAGFIDKTWLRKLSYKNWKSGTSWLAGLVLLLFGCVFIYFFFRNLSLNPSLFLIRPHPLGITTATPTIWLEPTWTVTH